MAEQQNNDKDGVNDPGLIELCSVLELSEHPVYCLDEIGRVLAANRKASENLIRPRESILHRHARNVDPRIADWPVFFERLRAAGTLDLDPVLEGTDPRISSRALQARMWRPAGRELAVVALHDVRSERERDLATSSRDAILVTISAAAARYLADEDWDASCNLLLADLGKATGVSRVYIFETHYDRDERLLFSQRFEWVAPGITPQIGNPELQSIPMAEAGYGRWLNLLSRGRLVAGQVKDFPASERELLESQSIYAIAAVPIFTGSKWWGMMGFDECTGPRDWGVAETEALRTVASLFGLATERRESARAARSKRDNVAHEARLVAMGEMASSIAHEINQPLAAISNYCETGIAALSADVRDNEILSRALNGAASQAQRAGEIIRRLREFVRKGDTTRSLVDLNQLVAETISLVEHDARANNIRILNECDNQLPKIHACRIQIQQVLFNLIRNAIEAIEEYDCGLVRSVRLRSARPNPHLVRLDVVDTGPGLRPHQATSIFEPFETSKPDGMGLGLSISRSIMDEHGGTLSIDFTHRGGACFQIGLPCLDGESDG